MPPVGKGAPFFLLPTPEAGETWIIAGYSERHRRGWEGELPGVSMEMSR